MTCKSHVSIDEVIDLLNEALAADPAWMSALIATRIPCTAALAEHPSIQVASNGEFGLPEGAYVAGVLGLLNGLFGTDERGWGPICAVVDTQDLKHERPLIRRFDRTKLAQASGAKPGDLHPKAIAG